MKYLLFILLGGLIYTGCASTTNPDPGFNTDIDSMFSRNISTLYGHGNKIPDGNQNISYSNIVWKDSLGVRHSLDEAIADGETILLNFWATWCPPCAYELPDLKAVSDSMTKLGVRVIGISVDQGETILEDVQTDVEFYKLPYQIVIDPKAITFANYRGDGSIPYSIIINRNGFVRFILPGQRTKEQFITYLHEALK